MHCFGSFYEKDTTILTVLYSLNGYLSQLGQLKQNGVTYVYLLFFKARV